MPKKAKPEMLGTGMAAKAGQAAQTRKKSMSKRMSALADAMPSAQGKKKK